MSAASKQPIRILTAVPICDGHDSAINTINLEFVRHGIEVIYLGYHRSVRDIVRAAIQEDVRAIGLSSYNGGHIEFFTEVIALLRKFKAAHIGVFGGGGGTITPDDARVMQRRGVDRLFFAGTPMSEIVAFVKKRYGKPIRVVRRSPDRAHGLTEGLPSTSSRRWLQSGSRSRVVIGITGPGGAGKTTLIDELVLRQLTARPQSRIAVLSHDPSVVAKGALLGDRATMIYSQDDRVFMRSLASRGRAGGLAPETDRWLRRLKGGGFDMIFVETVGTGQEAVPFRKRAVDRTVLVMNSDYGARLQLQKIAMLDAADIVVLNKSDLAGARTAMAELEQRLAVNRQGQKLVGTVAKHHRDPGVDELFQLLCESNANNDASSP